MRIFQVQEAFLYGGRLFEECLQSKFHRISLKDKKNQVLNDYDADKRNGKIIQEFS